jgi:hypothetical protein
VKLVLIGFLTALTFFLFFGAGPYVVSEPLILLVLGVGLVFLMFGFLRRYGWNEKTLRHKFSLAVGAVGFLIALTPLQELDISRPDSTQGMLVVGIVAFVMLVLLNRKLRSS